MAGMVLVLTTALSAADIDGNDVNHRPRYSAFFLCSDKQHPSRAAQETYQRPETSLQLEPEKKNERDVRGQMSKNVKSACSLEYFLYLKEN